MARRHQEIHLVERIGWLRAAVLGANDGIISTASLMLGVISAGSPPRQAVVAGVAGLVAGAMAMAAGEYVSVSSQSDTEKADRAREKQEIATSPESETEELAQIYVKRGLDLELARTVARQLMVKDALGAHLHDELGILAQSVARPIQAGLTSALTFSVGAAAPLILTLLAPQAYLLPLLALGSLFFLSALGLIGARIGGAAVLRPTLRVAFWGALAMAVTTGIGTLFGEVV